MRECVTCQQPAASSDIYCKRCATGETLSGDTIRLAPEQRWEPKASKHDSAKPDISLVPYIALKLEAEALMVGERKYGRYNYTKGHKASQLISAAMRHLLAYYNGEENDPIDGQSHIGSVRACMAMLARQQELGTLIDDRYKPEKP